MIGNIVSALHPSAALPLSVDYLIVAGGGGGGSNNNSNSEQAGGGGGAGGLRSTLKDRKSVV